MRIYLYWWNKLSKSDKQSLKIKYGIDKILYEDIKNIYKKEKL